MTEGEFNEMTPQQQADMFFAELGNMLREAQQDLVFRPDNEDTLVVSGMTTIVSVRPDLYQ